MADLSHAAIQSALSQDWKQAITINLDILQQDKEDVEAMCRLAYAYSQSGNVEAAKKIYRKILAIDQYHPIAKKNLERINGLITSSSQVNERVKSRISPHLFIEEPGKTKTVLLRNIAPNKYLAQINIGDCVALFAKNHSVEVRDQDKTYLGALPDDIAFRMIRFLKAGNTYQAYVKNVNKNTLSIFIRETRRVKRYSMQSSFSLVSYMTEAGAHGGRRRLGKVHGSFSFEAEPVSTEE